MPPRLRTERSAPEVGRRFPLAAAQTRVLGMPGHNSPGLWRWPGGVRARRRLMRMITDQESRVSLWVGSVRSAGRCGGAGDPGTTSLDYGPSVHRRYIRSGGFDSNSLKRPVTKQVTTPPGNDRLTNDVLGRLYLPDLQLSDPARRYRTKPAFMVGEKSTVRFHKCPAKKNL
jgi:hypothetical protein